MKADTENSPRSLKYDPGFEKWPQGNSEQILSVIQLPNSRCPRESGGFWQCDRNATGPKALRPKDFYDQTGQPSGETAGTQVRYAVM